MTNADVEIADAVRRVAAGQPAGGVTVARRARRGDDELLLLTAGRTWWVARRVAGQVRVCAYIGDVEADRDFDLFLLSPSPRGTWVEEGAPAAA